MPIQSVGFLSRRAALMFTSRRFFADESGATAIEYGLIAAGISVAIIVVVGELGLKLGDIFARVGTGLK